MVALPCLRRLFVSSLVFFTTVAGLLAAEKARVWTDVTGKHKTTAEFVDADEEQVTLRKPGTKKTVTMKLSRLSQADREYVQQRLEALKAETPSGDTGADDANAEEVSNEEDGNEEGTETPPSSPVSAAPSSPVRSQPNVANSVRNAVFRAETRDQMRQIAIALVNYESERGKYPQSTAMTSSDGKSGLSWRVAILPMLDENALYQQFRLQEPWDSPHNKKLIERMPKIYQSPGSALERGFTNYVGIAGPNTILNNSKRPAKTTNVTDGTSKTIMIVEADDTHGVIWTKPDDYPWDVANPSAGLGNIWSGNFFGAMADGSIHFLSVGNTPETLNGFFSINGGELVELDE